MSSLEDKMKLKSFLRWSAILVVLGVLEVSAAKLDKLILAGPFASVSHPLVLMANSGALSDIAHKVEFRLWKNPDELRAMSIQGSVDISAIPTNLAAMLYNKGVDIKIMNVSVWSILGIITRDPSLKTLEDFKGKTIAMPFRSDMPDIVFEQLVAAKGMDIKKDFNLQYVSSPIDAMQLLVMRRIDHALLAEPATSIALRKSGSFPISIVAPELHRSVVLEDVWGEVFHTEARIPEAGLGVLNSKKLSPQVLGRINEEYTKALAWYKANPQEAAKIIAKAIPMLDEKGLVDSLDYVDMEVKPALAVKDSITFFFQKLYEKEPKSIGSKMPDEDFYLTLE